MSLSSMSAILSGVLPAVAATAWLALKNNRQDLQVREEKEKIKTLKGIARCLKLNVRVTEAKVNLSFLAQRRDCFETYVLTGRSDSSNAQESKQAFEKCMADAKEPLDWVASVKEQLRISEEESKKGTNAS